MGPHSDSSYGAPKMSSGWMQQLSSVLTGLALDDREEQR